MKYIFWHSFIQRGKIFLKQRKEASVEIHEVDLEELNIEKEVVRHSKWKVTEWKWIVAVV
jgi:hypothetical protein